MMHVFNAYELSINYYLLYCMNLDYHQSSISLYLRSLLNRYTIVMMIEIIRITINNFIEYDVCI